jgi:hypothetical protein
MEPLAATHKAANPPPNQSKERIGTSPSEHKILRGPS